MGTDDGRAGGSAVVDTDTRVYGTDNLFIVDASIYPGQGTSNPSGSIVTVAERAFDRISAIHAPVPGRLNEQCGGSSWTGSFLCSAGLECVYENSTTSTVSIFPIPPPPLPRPVLSNAKYPVVQVRCPRRRGTCQVVQFDGVFEHLQGGLHAGHDADRVRDDPRAVSRERAPRCRPRVGAGRLVTQTPPAPSCLPLTDNRTPFMVGREATGRKPRLSLPSPCRAHFALPRVVALDRIMNCTYIQPLFCSSPNIEHAYIPTSSSTDDCFN